MTTTQTYEEVKATANRALRRFSEEPLSHFIGGEWVKSISQSVLENVSPIDGSVIGVVASGDEQDIEAAVKSSSAAFPEWANMPGQERKKILHKVADLIVERASEIAAVETADTGQPIRFMSSAAMRGAENFRFFADAAPGSADGKSMPTKDHLNYSIRQPIGPVGVITPWNTPFMLSTWKIAPALAAGCTVVHKPAEWSPCSAAILAEIAFEAGVPSGVFNLVNGVGEQTGRALTESEGIKAVAFVGESRTGSLIQAQGAPSLKRVHFELGGKNPVLVFDDANLERALDAVIFMIFSLNGERCTSSSRLLVQSSIHDEFVARLEERVRALRVGDPLNPDVEIGPLIHPLHCEKVRSYLAIGVSEGATVIQAASEFSAQSNYVNPAVFVGADETMRISNEEIFGPVLTVISFETERQAIEIANNVEFGLAGYIWTGDTGRAHRLARDLEVGMVWVNSQNVRHLPTPFGGSKKSGVGRDGGDYSFDFYMETKNVAVAYDTHTIATLGGQR